MSIWASRQYISPRGHPHERERVRECVRRALALKVLDVIPESSPHTIRWEMTEVTEPSIRAFEPPRDAIEGRLEIAAVRTMDVQMYRPPQIESLTLPALARSAVQELRHRAKRALGRLAFWRKDGAK